jgi:predicted hydrocarbon binding protein
MRDNTPPGLVGMPFATLRTLVRQSGAPLSPQAVHALRQAGYAGGSELAAAFDAWIRAGDGESDAAELGLEEFNARVAAFFEQAGWGKLAMSSIHDMVAAVDIADCWEPHLGLPASGPRCHVSTGAIAAFFSNFAPYTLGSMEVECAGAGDPHCRFLLGPPEVLDELYDHVAEGRDYDDALSQLSEVSASA